MGRSPCCDEVGVKKGPWTPDEDKKLEDFIKKNGHGSWRALPKLAGLNRCGKSCRLRWTNYLRPDIKRGPFSEKEEEEIIQLHSVLGNKWSAIAMRLPGRTDNEIKNYWNTHLRKKLLQMGIDPVTHRPRADLALLASIPNLLAAVNTGNLPASIAALDNALRLQTDAAQMAKVQLFQSLVQVLSSSTSGATSSMSAINSYMNSNLLGNYQLPNDLSSFTNQLQGLGHESKPIGLIDQVPNQTLPSLGFTNLSFDGVLHNHQIQHPNKPYNGKLDVFSQFDGSYASQLNFNSGYSQMSSPLTNPNSDSTHSFMSNSSENFAVDHMKPSSSSSAATYNMQLGGVNMEELNGEFYWNDVLDQNSLHNWSGTL